VNTVSRATCSPYPQVKRLQSGFSLVEILIALTLGLVLIGGLLQIFLNSKQTYRINDELSRLQENARFAIDLLTRDIREAGYLGCLSGSGSLTVTITLNTPGGFLYNFGVGLEGYESTGTSTWSPSLDASITSPLDGGDVIVIRKVLDSGTRVVPPYMVSTSANLHVTSGNGLSQFDVVVVSDCVDAAVLQVTSSNPDTSGSIAHNTGVGAPGNNTTNLGKIYQGDAQLMKVATISYFLRTGAGGGPALWRKVGSNAAEELVEGVEDMQIRYGEDTDSDGAANRYVTANQVANWDDVVSARVSLLMQSLNDNLTSAPQTYQFNGATVTAGDRRLREVVTTTIAIRNHLR
jgi:type IV pilus assembly protein PilW